MRKYLFLLFLGVWTAIVPFLPIHRGSTQTAILIGTGILVAVIALLSLRQTHTP